MLGGHGSGNYLRFHGYYLPREPTGKIRAHRRGKTAVSSMLMCSHRNTAGENRGLRFCHHTVATIMVRGHYIEASIFSFQILFRPCVLAGEDRKEVEPARASVQKMG